MLAYQLERLKRSRATPVIATTTDPEDDPIADMAAKLEVHCVRGHPTDLMARHAHVTRATGADIICLSGADDPLVEPFVFDLLVSVIQMGATYAKTEGWPLGMNGWAWTRAAMEEGHREATAPDERQHVAPYFDRRPKRYPLTRIRRPGADLYGTHRLTVDSTGDFELVSRVYEALWPDNHHFTLEDMLMLLEQHPEWADLNAAGLHGTAARDAIYDVSPVE